MMRSLYIFLVWLFTGKLKIWCRRCQDTGLLGEELCACVDVQVFDDGSCRCWHAATGSLTIADVKGSNNQQIASLAMAERLRRIQ